MNWIRKLFCKHEFEFLRTVKWNDPTLGTCGTYKIFYCQKCLKRKKINL